MHCFDDTTYTFLIIDSFYFLIATGQVGGYHRACFEGEIVFENSSLYSARNSSLLYFNDVSPYYTSTNLTELLHSVSHGFLTVLSQTTLANSGKIHPILACYFILESSNLKTL